MIEDSVTHSSHFASCCSEIPDAVFQHVLVGNCADSQFANSAPEDFNIYPHDILWWEDPTVQRRQRERVASAIVDLQAKLRGPEEAGAVEGAEEDEVVAEQE